MQGYTYYDNVKSQGESRWSTPPNFQKDIGHLNRDEVQVYGEKKCFYDDSFVSVILEIEGLKI